MKFIKTKKGIAFLAVLVVAVAASVGAYAYWTTTGSGDGSAVNGTSNGTLVLHATFAPGLTPGATEPVHFTADNAGTSNLFVGTVTSVVSTSDPTCLPADFTVAPVDENQSIPAGGNLVPLLVDGSITFANTTANQNGCKGATVTLTLSSN